MVDGHQKLLAGKTIGESAKICERELFSTNLRI
jgi:hypothetical protein